MPPPKTPSRATRETPANQIMQIMQMMERVADDLAEHKQEQSARNKVLDERHEHATRTIENVDSGVKEILVAMVGNEKFEQKGLVHTVVELKKLVGEHETFKNKFMAYAAVGSILWAALSGWVVDKAKEIF
ncbi:hypothetical protein [Hymenobacter koreensis]|uniref:TMhelix containing protein n=1 Tax=Hymenobacter koreensis TaxID=1084523 RepID=A0ABP8JJW1_9BACT